MLVFLDESGDPGLKLADMVAGAINRSHSGKPDAEDYIRVVRHRKAHVQVWPNREKDET